MTSTLESPVLVVGAGPVGLALAVALARHRVMATVIDQGRGAGAWSKALSVNAATLKAVRGLGLESTFLEHGVPVHDIDITLDGRRCAHVDNRRLAAPHDFYLSLPQPRSEAILRQGFETLGGRVHYEHTLVGLEPRAGGGLDATLATGPGETQCVHYPFVVGCDGAHSAVRQLSGIGFEGNDLDAHFIMGDVVLAPDEAPRGTAYHLRGGEFLILLPMPGALTRMVVGRQGALPAQDGVPGRAELQAALDRLHERRPVIRSLVWSSSARLHDRLANTNQAGDVFLAGDAFHLFSPIGGQGMNTGLQDAVNLAWKLAWSVRGICRRALLDSYRPERSRAVRRVAESTARNTRLLWQLGPEAGIAAGYAPRMANRAFFRHGLAQQFSGLEFHHGEDDARLEGRHVPFCEFDREHLGIKERSLQRVPPSTYDVPRVGKNLLVAAPDVRPGRLSELKQLHSDVLAIHALDPRNDAAAVAALELDRNEVCLIRPDATVGFSGSLDRCRDHLSHWYPT